MSKYKLVLKDEGFLTLYRAITLTSENLIDESKSRDFDVEKDALDFAKRNKCDKVVKAIYESSDIYTPISEKTLWVRVNKEDKSFYLKEARNYIAEALISLEKSKELIPDKYISDYDSIKKASKDVNEDLREFINLLDKFYRGEFTK